VQITLASAICSRDLPDSESGKNNSGSADRQAAADRQLAPVAGQLAPVAGRAAVAYPETWSSPPTTLLSLVPTLGLLPFARSQRIGR
jgi:hypothetical protein